MASSTQSSGNPGTLDPREIIYVCRRNCGKILMCLVLTVGGALCILHYMRPVYASHALLEVAADSKLQAGDPDAPDTLKTMELKIASQPVLLAVIKANKLTDDRDFMAPESPLSTAYSEAGNHARDWFVKTAAALGIVIPDSLSGVPPRVAESPTDTDGVLLRKLGTKVSVDLVRGSRLISVTAEDHDPAKAQRLVRSVIEQFFQQSLDAQRGDENSSRQLLQAEASRAAAESKAAAEKLQDYREKYNAVSLTDKQDVVVERLRVLNQEVAEAKNSRMALEADQDQITRLSGEAPEQLLNIRSIASVPEVADLRKSLALQDSQVASLAKRYGPMHPTMIQARSQLDDLRASLDSAIRKAGNLVLHSYQSAQALESDLESALADQEKAALDLDRIAIPYHALEQQVQADNAAYQQVLDKLKLADVNRSLMSAYDVDGTSVSVVEQPLLPVHPVRPSPRLWLAISVAVGLFFGCGSALLSSAMDNTLTSVDGAETLLGLPVLVTVPRSRRARLASGPVVVRQPASMEAESFRTLRASLSLLPSNEEHRSVLFVSAVPGEGKSYCSANYAAAVAQQGLRTLLIDGDLRRPTLRRGLVRHSSRGVQGLSDCLRNPESFSQAVQPTVTANLFLLGDTYGKPGGAELVARDGMAEIIRRALESYDRVVIDSAPLIAVSDTLQIAKHVQTLCLVVHAGKTPRRVVQRACKLLEKVARRTPVGVVLNKIPRGQSANYHYYNSKEVYA